MTNYIYGMSCAKSPFESRRWLGVTGLVLFFLQMVLVIPSTDAFLKSMPQRQPGSKSGTSRGNGDSSGFSSGASLHPVPYGVKPKQLTTLEERLLSELERKGTNQCWKSAVAELEQKCAVATVSEQTRSNLALQLTRCQLEGDGKFEGEVLSHCLGIYGGSSSSGSGSGGSPDALKACVRKLSDSIYTIYVQFYIHVDALCFHFQEELFQERTESAVFGLSKASVEAHKSLNDVHRKTEGIASHVVTLKKLQEEELVDLEKIRASTEWQLQHQKRQEEKSLALHSSLEELLLLQHRFQENHGQLVGDLLGNLTHQQLLLRSIEASSLVVVQDVRGAAEDTRKLTQGQSAALLQLEQFKSQIELLGRDNELAKEKAADLLELMNKLQGFTTGPLLAHLQSIEAASISAQKLAQSVQEQQLALNGATQHIMDSIAQVKALQTRVAGAFVNVEAAMFYFFTLVSVLLLTTARRLSDARFMALVTLTAGFGLEIYASRHHPTFFIQLGHMFSSTEVPLLLAGMEAGLEHNPSLQLLLASIGQMYLRRFLVAIVVAQFVYAAWRYRSPEQREREIVRQEIARVFADSNIAEGMSLVVAAARMFHADAAQYDNSVSGCIEDVTYPAQRGQRGSPSGPGPSSPSSRGEGSPSESRVEPVASGDGEDGASSANPSASKRNRTHSAIGRRR